MCTLPCTCICWQIATCIFTSDRRCLHHRSILFRQRWILWQTIATSQAFPPCFGDAAHDAKSTKANDVQQSSSSIPWPVLRGRRKQQKNINDPKPCDEVASKAETTM